MPSKEEFKALKKFITPVGRLSFANPWTPKQGEYDKEPVYRGTLSIPKETDITVIKKAIHYARMERFGPDKARWPKERWPVIKDGDEMQDYPDMAGHWVISFKSKDPPGMVSSKAGPDGRPMVITDQSQIYNGCHGRASLFASAYDTAGNRGVSLFWNGFQKVKDDKPFGRKRAQDEFEAIEDASDDADSYGDDYRTDAVEEFDI